MVPWKRMVGELSHPKTANHRDSVVPALESGTRSNRRSSRYGGDCLITQANPPDVSTPDVGRDSLSRACAVHIARWLGRHDRDAVGTSFAAPKVTKIAARLQAVLPDESCLLYRALIAQSAQWPQWSQQLTKPQKTELLRRIGYGIPDIERATTNTDHRVTFIAHRDRT